MSHPHAIHLIYHINTGQVRRNLASRHNPKVTTGNVERLDLTIARSLQPCNRLILRWYEERAHVESLLELLEGYERYAHREDHLERCRCGATRAGCPPKGRAGSRRPSRAGGGRRGAAGAHTVDPPGATRRFPLPRPVDQGADPERAARPAPRMGEVFQPHNREDAAELAAKDRAWREQYARLGLLLEASLGPLDPVPPHHRPSMHHTRVGPLPGSMEGYPAARQRR